MPRAIDFGGDGRGCMVQHGKSTYDRACCSSSAAVYASKLPWKSSDSSEEIKRQDTHIPFKTLTASARYLLFAIPRQVDHRRIAPKVNLRAIHVCLTSVISVVYCIVESRNVRGVRVTRRGDPGEGEQSEVVGEVIC